MMLLDFFLEGWVEFMNWEDSESADNERVDMLRGEEAMGELDSE